MSTVNRGIITDGLVLCLDASNSKSFVSGSTTWNDLTRNANNGTLINSPTFNSSNGGSIVFDGTNKYVSVPKQSNLVNVTQFSMCAWMKRAGTNSLIIISQYETIANDIAFELWGDGNAYFEVGNGANSYGFVSNNSANWQFMSMTFNGSLVGNSNRLKGYINAVEQTLTFNGTIPATTGTVNGNFILGSFLSSLNYGNGNISNVQIYNRALTATEIQQNYNMTRTRFGV